jgi:uncharacterized integral membrane protein
MTSEQGGLSSDPAKVAKQRDTRNTVRLVGVVVLVVLLIAFVVKNSARIPIHFIFFTANVRLIWVLLTCAVLGALIDRLIIWRQRNRKRDAAKEAGRT